MAEVFINGEKLSVRKGSTILHALNLAKAPHRKDCKLIAVKKGKALESKDFFVETTKGRLSIQIADPLFPLWSKHHRGFQGTGVGWTTKNAVTFGPIDLTPSRLKATGERVNYRSRDVFLSFGGFDPANTYLCFSKTDHEGVYGPPRKNLGLVGKAISGGFVIPELGRGDSILRVYPSTVEKKEVSVLLPEEIDEKVIEDGMQIWTCAEAELDAGAPHCSEHFLATVGEGFFKVDHESTTFVCNENLVGIPPQKENTVYRPKGSITVRNVGTRAGAVYIYRKDAPFTPSHSFVGKIVRGVELVEHANRGDKILIKTVPERLVVVGMSQKQATEYLSKRGIKHVRVGDKNDDAVIIEQRPKLTMEVMDQGSAVTLGISPQVISWVDVWDRDSPKSALHFRIAADMVYSPVGKLQVLATSDEMLILSSKDTRTIKPIPAEKNPSGVVEEGTIGVTNSRRRLTGLMGIRLKADKTYGPTGEAFEATNLIGKVTSGLEALRNKKAGDTIYLMEKSR